MDTFYDKASNLLISFGPKLLLSVAIFLAGIWLIKKLGKTMDSILSRRKVDKSLQPFLTGTVSIILQVLLVFGVMQVLGIQLTIFAALIGAVGVAAGLALSGTLQNFASGVLILLMKPFRIGDNINTQSLEGTVTTIRIFYTVVTTYDNRALIIPNSKLSNEVIINLSKEGKRRLDIELKFGFDISFEKVRSVFKSILDTHSSLLKDPTYRIGIDQVGSDGYTVIVNTWINAHGFQDTKMQLNEIIVSELTRSGLKLPGL